ncbi:MAG TPA: OsmC family protein [Candidatus Eisenbacteria bacterium]|nr:OsmC family protein [Candidatus Eisenbacteria bacterium]
MQRKGSAVWQGGLKDGKGTVSTDSGVLRQTPYNFAQRFENAPGTNPEELIAAAHAACFSMALSAVLGESNLKADRIETTATATFEKTDAGFTVTKINLDVTADIPNADNAAFQAAAEKAKKTCPISRLLAAASITMEARLRAGSRA